jgi:hypothetical protein
MHLYVGVENVNRSRRVKVITNRPLRTISLGVVFVALYTAHGELTELFPTSTVQ